MRPPATAPARSARPRPPKLGVVPREVTLLPRHWDWLAAHRRRAVALRKLVEQARRDNEVRDQARRQAAYLFMCSLAGNLRIRGGHARAVCR